MTTDPADRWDPAFEKLLRQTVPLLPDDLDPAADLRAFGLDSLASVRLLVEIESTYDITVPDESLTRAMFETPAGLWDVVCGLLPE